MAVSLFARFQFLSRDVVHYLDKYPNRWVSVIFVLAACVILIPHFVAEAAMRSKLRELKSSDVYEVYIQDLSTSDHPRQKVSTELRDNLIEQFNQCDLYHRVERSEDVCRIYVELLNGKNFAFDVKIPGDRTTDLSLAFAAGRMGSHVIVPDGRKWLDEAMPKRKSLDE